MTEQTDELHENYRQILDQVEILSKNSNFASDPAIKSSFKVISDRLKIFLPAESPTCDDVTLNGNLSPGSVESTNVTETIVENDKVPSSAAEDQPEPSTSANIESLDIRITYESPLEMMRSNKTK